MDLKDKYKQLNDSFKPTLTYTFQDVGFYSAYNNLILNMAFCLKHKIRIRIYSKRFIYFQGVGWNKVLEPCLPETNNPLYRINRSEPELKKSFESRFFAFVQNAYGLFSRNLLMNASFMWSRTFWFSKELFDIPELGINGDLREVCRALIGLTYKFNEEYQEKIKVLRNSIALPKDFIGMHIRRGDKILERDLEEIDKYFAIAKKLSNTRNVFVMTDDYTVITSLQENYKDWNIFTLTFPYERGFVLKESTGDVERMDKEMVKVFASLEIMRESEMFIGTVSTNPGMFLGMAMDREKVHYIDSDDWIIL